MRILVVSQHFYPDTFRINDIVDMLVKAGHTVRVVTGLPDYATGRIPAPYRWFRRRRETYRGAQVVRVPTLSRKRGKLCRALNYLSFVVSGCLYTRWMRDRFDAVLSYETSPVLQVLPAITYRKRTGARLVLYCCDLWPESLKAWGVGEGHWLFRFMNRVSGKIFRAADVVAVTSPAFRGYLCDVNGVDPTRIADLPQHAEDLYAAVCGEYLEDDTVDFVFAGNVGAVQQVDCLLRAAVRLPAATPVRVHIVGDGSERAACEQLARDLSLGDRVRFHGQHPLEAMPVFYRLADCFVLTLRGGDAIARTIPGKLQGYLSAGKPVIGAADGAAAAVIAQAGCGGCVAAGDDEGLAALMLDVVQHREAYRQRGEQGRRYYEQHYTRQRFYQTLAGLLGVAGEPPS